MDEAKKEAREKEEEKTAEAAAQSSSFPFDLDDEHLDPYVILNSWYRKKGINIQIIT